MDRQQIPFLLNYAKDPNCLGFARLAANGIVSHDRMAQESLCAATLSLLLDMARINVGVINDVVSLSTELRRRGWDVIRTPDTAECGSDAISEGDVGVQISSLRHHIYVVVDAHDQTLPEVADNEAIKAHPHQVTGGETVPQTTYFLRAT
ncbi:hypothetical protein [Chromobacterium sp. IIBBL 290-4]|uniref:hypothetical protein n=1 Tax=Chromobacterium sp. IIBBL 290-4 TaxID=2953890 RepID=UPI0020B669F3|nr:hypothetical protein [Chromobacterium sp. IIBBL 290-4]UTH74468.1 hypothetical protein NKT35_23555 [Chromobacterium sp. IIBBL 290-4]